jgi:hypothetical protein
MNSGFVRDLRIKGHKYKISATNGGDSSEEEEHLDEDSSPTSSRKKPSILSEAAITWARNQMRLPT